MKNYTTLRMLAVSSAIVCGTYSAKAQITITNAYTPIITSYNVYGTDNSHTYSALPKGPNKTWDYHTMTSSETDTGHFFTPGSTPYSSDFLPSQLAVKGYSGNKALNYVYYTVNNYGSSEVGAVTDTISNGHVDIEVINPVNQVLTFPCKYGSAWGGTHRNVITGPVTQIGVDSGRIIENVWYADTVDSWGTIVTPMGGPYNCLRVAYYITRQIDSFYAHPTGGKWTFILASNNTFHHANSYTWWTNTPGNNLGVLSMNVDTNGNSVTSSFLMDTSTGIQSLSNFNYGYLFPNPAGNEVTIRTTSKDVMYAKITDVTGKEVMANTEMVNGVKILNTSLLPNGMYFYILSGRNGENMGAGKFIIQR